MPFPKIDNNMLNIGSGANQLVKIDPTGKLPPLDASLLANLPSSGGGGTSAFIPIATQVITSPVAQLDFTSGFDIGYKEFMVRGTDITLSSETLFGARVRIGGVFRSENGYTYGSNNYGNAFGTIGVSNASDNNFMVIPYTQSLVATRANAAFVMNITNPVGVLRTKAIHITGGGNGNAYNQGFSYSVGGVWNNNASDFSPFDGLRFIALNANITSGTFKLFGIL